MSLEDVKLAEQLPPFSEGLTITITRAERIKTLQRGFDGVRVVGKDENGVEYGEVLWVRPTIGAKSKLGAFVTELGKNLNEWVGKTITITRWRQKDREIQVIKAQKKTQK